MRKKEMSLGSLPVDEHVLLQQVLALLGPRSLLRLARVNSAFERMANDDFLWAPLTARLWANKHILKGLVLKNTPTQPYTRIHCTKEAYMSLKAAKLKRLLRLRAVSCAGVWEKHEFAELGVGSSSARLSEHTPVLLRPFATIWKASFYVSLSDGRRGFARHEEICSHKWEMHFKRGNANTPPWISSFHPDGTLSSEPHNPGGQFQWTLEMIGGEQYVRVGPYPPLLVQRTPNWGWQMENIHVYFEQREDRR